MRKNNKRSQEMRVEAKAMEAKIVPYKMREEDKEPQSMWNKPLLHHANPHSKLSNILTTSFNINSSNISINSNLKNISKMKDTRLLSNLLKRTNICSHNNNLQQLDPTRKNRVTRTYQTTRWRAVELPTQRIQARWKVAMSLTTAEQWQRTQQPM